MLSVVIAFIIARRRTFGITVFVAVVVTIRVTLVVLLNFCIVKAFGGESVLTIDYTNRNNKANKECDDYTN